jgi:hypothetical protein
MEPTITMSKVTSHQRFTKKNPCPVCGGIEEAHRGHGTRCYGFLSDDGKYAHCTREDFAEDLPIEDASQTYAHILSGECRCGKTHDGLGSTVVPFRPRDPSAIYNYEWAKGDLAFQVLRFGYGKGKTFSQRQPDGKGGWIPNIQNVPRPLPLYNLPELIKAIARHDPIIFVEGENDVSTVTSKGGIATTSAMGALKWSHSFGSEVITLFKDAHVIVLRDADEKGQQHRDEIASSLYGIVSTLKCPDLPGLQGNDISDWIQEGHTLDELWAIAAQSEDWRPSAIPDIEAGEGCEDFTGRWSALGITITATNLDTDRDGLKCYLVVRSKLVRAPLVSHTFNLSSDRGRTQLIDRLSRKHKQVTCWDELIETFCHEVVATYSEGPPATPMYAVPRSQTPYDIKNLCARREIGLLIGAGDGGKSYLELYLAASAVMGKSGIEPFTINRKLRWLMLDWERSLEFHQSRLARILEGMGIQPTGELPGLFYRRMQLPLHESVQQIKTLVKEHQIDVVSVDSAGMASGDEPETSRAALKVARALHAIGVTSLEIHHVNKGDALGLAPGRRLSAYGSVYWENEAFIGWSMEVSRGLGPTQHTTLFHQCKNNDGPYHPNFALGFDFSGGKTVIKAVDVVDHPELTSIRNPGKALVHETIADQGPLSYKQLCELTGLRQETLYNHVSDLVKDGVVEKLDARDQEGRSLKKVGLKRASGT